MHLFVRDLSGHSLSFDASDVSSLQYAIADRTAIPVEDQRLVFGSSQLVAGRTLASYGIASGNTVGLALRLRGGAPKKRCGFMLSATDRCSQAAVRIVGDCQLCSASFCSRHRLAEDHSCPKLSTCREEAFERNKARLEADATHTEKLARV
ncbi:AN1-type zinc finger protein [Rhodotorula toruloides]|uniref:AN1-type zinc finger protein n=1 Tax=Rhodotorula toruloides TaxID=5286 RepID=A0A511K9B6_RHOTO|nr:AN1-type zinc finger protein [Rhodotorula toruloides]